VCRVARQSRRERLQELALQHHSDFLRVTMRLSETMRGVLCLATLLLAGAEVAKFRAAPRSDLVAPNWLGHCKM